MSRHGVGRYGATGGGASFSQIFDVPPCDKHSASTELKVPKMYRDNEGRALPRIARQVEVVGKGVGQVGRMGVGPGHRDRPVAQGRQRCLKIRPSSRMTVGSGNSSKGPTFCRCVRRSRSRLETGRERGLDGSVSKAKRKVKVTWYWEFGDGCTGSGAKSGAPHVDTIKEAARRWTHCGGR